MNGAKTIIVFGGSFNPPLLSHRRIADELSRHFDEVVVVPCGHRPDKLSVDGIDARHRARLVELGFEGLLRVRVDLFDLSLPEFTRTWQLDRRYDECGEVWHAIGADLFAGGARQASQIQSTWERGSWVWGNLRFAALTRPGVAFNPADLPPRVKLIQIEVPGASSEVREMLARGEPLEGCVLPKVEEYIRREGLYLPSAENLNGPRGTGAAGLS